MRRGFIGAMAIALAVAATAHASVLCQKRSGALFARDTCKKKETTVDPAALGLVGPKGDPGSAGEARAFACSTASFDGSLVAPCVGRPSTKITSIIANPVVDNVTCFVLDPSIDAKSAVVIAGFSEAAIGTFVNVILYAYGTDDQVGCPANSIVVATGHWRQADAGTGMYLESARLSLSVAVM